MFYRTEDPVVTAGRPATADRSVNSQFAKRASVSTAGDAPSRMDSLTATAPARSIRAIDAPHQYVPPTSASTAEPATCTMETHDATALESISAAIGEWPEVSG